MNAQTAPASSLSTVAITNEAALRVLAEKPIIGAAAVAHASGLAQKNMARQLDLLKRDGLVREEAAHDDRGRDAISFNLTDAGRRALQAMDLAAGRLELATVGLAAAANDVLLLTHEQMRPNPLQPRKHFDREELDLLKAAIVAAKDVLQVFIVFPADAEAIHTLFDGERRWRCVGELIEEGMWPAGRRLRAIERENTPGQVAFIGLATSNPSAKLTMLEQARAYEALVAETGWSARNAGIQTGRDPRTVQEMLKVLREAEPRDITIHEMGDMTWEELRGTVRERQEGEEAEGPAQRDLEEITSHEINPEGADGDRMTLPEIANWKPTPSSRHTCGQAGISITVSQTYALAELAYKARQQQVRDGDTGGAAYIADNANQDRDFAILWRNGFIAWGADRSGVQYARLSPYGEQRLAQVGESGWPVDYIMTKGYRTPWLRYSPGDEVADPLIVNGMHCGNPTRAAEARRGFTGERMSSSGSSARKKIDPAATLAAEKPLSAIEKLALVELAHKLNHNHVEPNARSGRLVVVRKYWLDQTSSDLRSAGLIDFTHGYSGGPHAHLTFEGKQKLRNMGVDIGVVLNGDLSRARSAAGLDGPFQPYATPWLNPEETPAAGDARMHVDHPQMQPPASDAADDEYTLAHDALGAVAKALDSGHDFNPLDLFKIAGVAFPLCLSRDGEIVDSDGEAVLALVGHGDLVDELLKARALLFVTALNDLVAPFTREHRHQVLARKVEDGPATPIRRSIRPEDFTCLEDGVRIPLLARHLRQVFGLSPADYIERWGLPKDYPFVAPNEMQRRSDLMKTVGVDPGHWNTDQEEEEA